MLLLILTQVRPIIKHQQSTTIHHRFSVIQLQYIIRLLASTIWREFTIHLLVLILVIIMFLVRLENILKVSQILQLLIILFMIKKNELQIRNWHRRQHHRFILERNHLRPGKVKRKQIHLSRVSNSNYRRSSKEMKRMLFSLIWFSIRRLLKITIEKSRNPRGYRRDNLNSLMRRSSKLKSVRIPSKTIIRLWHQFSCRHIKKVWVLEITVIRNMCQITFYSNFRVFSWNSSLCTDKLCKLREIPPFKYH